jgi:hypothetical protein
MYEARGGRMLSLSSAPFAEEAAMSQITQLPVPSETQLWVTWVIALVTLVALVGAVVVGLVLVFA